jgi:hypothetical protein
MIPFTLGFIGGFAFAILCLMIYAVLRASSMRSREEEAWVENIGCTMQGMSDQTERMPSTLRELHRLEEETEGAERKSEARERTE